jgi:hypothetical protein
MTSIGEILTDDIRRQKEIAEHALAQAKIFDDAVRSGNSDPLLKDAVNVLFDVARRLAANSSTISSSASEVIRQSGDKR